MEVPEFCILDDGLVMGGGQGFALRLAEDMRERGIAVRFASPARSRFGAEVRRRGFRLDDVTYPSLVPPAVWAMPRTLARLRATMESVAHGGVVIGNTARCQAYASAAWLTLPQAPTLVHLMHEHDSAHRRSARAVYRRIGSLVAIGDNGAQAYREQLPGVPVDHVNNFLSSKDMQRVAAHRVPAPGGDRPVVGVLARMIPEKGLVELVEELAAEPEAWDRLLVGAPSQDQAYEGRLRRRIDDLGLGPRVELLGEVSDLHAFFARVDVLVVPSTGREGQPTVILEALLHGRSVVVRAPVWSSHYDGLPVRPYTTSADLAAALGGLGDGAVDVAVLSERFGGAEVLETLSHVGTRDREAPPLSSYHDWHGEPGYFRDVIDHFPRDAKLLDIGCGTAWIGDHFDDYVGLDSSPEAVEGARSRGRNAFQHSVDEPLPFADGTFDGVVMKDLLEHVADPVAVVGEALRVLRPGGRVFASSPDAQRWVWDDYTHRRPFTRKSYRLLFADSGFEIERVSYESVMPGIGIVSGLTSAKRRPRPLAVLAQLPIVRRNVYVLARRPG